MKRTITAAGLVPALVLGFILPTSAWFWDRKDTAPYLADLSKNALMGEVITFEKEDWAVLGDDSAKLGALVVETLPDPGAGTLLLGGTILEVGSQVEKSALPGLRFQSQSSPTVTKTEFQLRPLFLDRDESHPFRVEVTLLSKRNTPPVARDMELETYENVSLTGYFDAVDTEGDTLTFRLMSTPARGAVTPAEDGSGQFVYRPYENKTGKDSFTYVAVDGAGNTSPKATVTICIQKQAKTISYPQLDGHPAHKSAVRLAEEGIYVGARLSGIHLFDPERPVTRSEFLAMAMDAAGMEPLEQVTLTGFADDDTIPVWSKGQVSAALKAGVIRGGRNEAGAVVFGGEQTITAAQAAVILDNLLGITDVPMEVFSPDAQPHWAGQAAANLAACGVIRMEDTAADTLAQPITLGDAALLLDGALDVLERR